MFTHSDNDPDDTLAPAYGSRFLSEPVPKYRLPEGDMPARLAYQLIHDELALDGNPALNLATFVTTWMEPEAEQLITESLNVNSIDQDEYPQTTEIQNRCVSILADLFHADDAEHAMGTATVGSSEAIHLAGLAMKWRWRSRQEAAGKPTDRPNLVMSETVQVCWEKFVRYFDVEPRFVPITPERTVIDPEQAAALVDENTIGVVGILGSTYTGEFEPIQALSDVLDDVQERTGLDVPLHVDGASGAFVAPFTQPDLAWDFRLPRVKSINASGHKYGLVYPGVGWALWRDKSQLPEDLIFHTNYLGGDQPTFDLNFSRGASQIVAQYYNFLRMGRKGYTEVMAGLMGAADYLRGLVEESPYLDLMSKPDALPLVCAKVADGVGFTAYDISAKMKERGWIVPAYTLAKDADHVSVVRVVVREGLSRDMAGLLLDDFRRAGMELGALPPELRSPVGHQPHQRAKVC
ncbi:MAG: glutamate decarboxylase [Myxococcales bacterium]|nr:glutamate decarboxylase [Myxococcales bacterium]